MKRIIIAMMVMLTFHSQSAMAATPKTVLDTSALECVYYNRVIDPQKERTMEYHDIVQCGSAYVKSACFGSYRMDSVLSTIPDGKRSQDLFLKLCNTYHPRTSYLLKSMADGKLTVYDRVMLDIYEYTESMPVFEWNIGTETKEVCGYKCQNATCRFRGRDWTVWFTEAIPISQGPWKFSGLPGMILRAEDSTGHHLWEAISVRKGSGPIFRLVRDYIKTTRERFNKEQYDYRMTPWKTIYNSGTIMEAKNADGTPVAAPRNKLFYNPIELE